jgi:hypothetical protein
MARSGCRGVFRIRSVALQDIRAIKLGHLTDKHATAPNFSSSSPGTKIADVNFVTGSRELRNGPEKPLQLQNSTSPSRMTAPNKSSGVLDCEPELTLMCVRLTAAEFRAFSEMRRQ